MEQNNNSTTEINKRYQVFFSSEYIKSIIEKMKIKITYVTLFKNGLQLQKQEYVHSLEFYCVLFL